MKRVALAACALALALSAADSTATPTGKKWFTLPVQYRVYQHTGINGVSNFQTVVLPGIERSFNRWIQPTCTKWAVTRGTNFTSPNDRTALGNDGVNRLIWLGGANWVLDAQTLGLTTNTFYLATGQLIDSDIEFNNNRTWKTTGTSTAIDVESIVTHEAGHFLGLDHTPSTAAVMYANYPEGSIKRELGQPDIDDVCSVYPKDTAAGSRLGDPCVQNADCAASTPALVCRSATGSTQKICTYDCTSNAGVCPSDYQCQTANTGSACFKRPTTTDLCKFCTTGSDCASGRCVRGSSAADGPPRQWCTVNCTDAADCGNATAYECATLTGSTTKVCRPKNLTCATAQCTDPLDCPVGFTCTSGMCQATGAIGDRCEIANYCQSCAVCVHPPGVDTLAYCQECCGSTGAGRCDSCPAVGCAGNETCSALSSSADRVCVATGGEDLCQYCDDATPCREGLACIAGACHAGCNPASPGLCEACFDLGDGTGVCACPGEVGQVGDACGGDDQGGFVACGAGTLCVGAPSTCRTVCSPNLAGACPTGERCGQVDGQYVCLASDVAGERCNECANGNTCAAGLTCFQGRCYPPCTPANPSCSTCVPTGTGVGVCACDDEVGQTGDWCGFDGNAVGSCPSGHLCMGQTCRQSCSLAQPRCPDEEQCFETVLDPVCAPDGADLTPPPGTVPDEDFGGCGCGTGQAGSTSLLLLGVLLALAGRRRLRA